MTAKAGHNAEARAGAIRDICRDIDGLAAERKVISDQIREIKQKRVKGDLDMKIADFNVAYRLYQLEQDDRDKLLDTLRETFSALGMGGQLDFLPAVETAPEKEQPEKEQEQPAVEGEGEEQPEEAEAVA